VVADGAVMIGTFANTSDRVNSALRDEVDRIVTKIKLANQPK
jgi:hypothetical protein